MNTDNSILNQMRKDAIEITRINGKTGVHIGGTLSLIEIMAVLYLDVMNYDSTNFSTPDRDRLILSKGHGALAQYLAMFEADLLTKEELYTYKSDNTFLYAHPSMNRKRGIEFSAGSLGQGLSLAVGVALALKKKDNFKSRIFTILGDGECDEGSVWESAASASHYQLNNITVVIDKNKLQYDGSTTEVLNMDSLYSKWISFGWDVDEVDGHSIEAIREVLLKKHEKPNAIIANTIKGKGVSFMENNQIWHNNRLSEKQYLEALEELK